jgi:putative ABC transport system permease protein
MNNFKFALRIFLKDKFFSTLNILGLALGISISIVLMLILKNDLNYDKHYANHDRIYRLGSHYVIPDVDEYLGWTARELAPILRQTYPEIEELVRIHERKRVHVKYDAKSFYETGIAQTDPTYFKIFTHKFVSGDVRTCLNDPKSVVVTRSTARKYFDNEDPIGRILVLDKIPYSVTAVIEDLPENTHLKFDILISGLSESRAGWDVTIENGKPIPLVMWNPDVKTYLLLPAGYDVNNFYDRFKGIYDEYFAGITEELGTNIANTPVLQPLADVHFSKYDEFEAEYDALIAFTGVGILIVILACINYMNLSTAKAIKRATEITMKRLSGSGKWRLVFSLLGESVFLSLISFVLAIGVVYLAIGPLNTLVNKQLSLDITTVLLSSLIALMIGVLSGIYPAFYLTNIPVIESLKGTFRNSKGALLLRRSLITVQFCISIFVVVCTLFMGNQMNFIRTKSLGFDKNNLLLVDFPDTTVAKQLPAIKNELLKNPNIITASASLQVMGVNIGGEQMFAEGPNGMEQRGCISIMVDDGYIDMMGMQLLQGRNFEEGENVDTQGVYIANESAVKMMGWGDDALGKKVSFFGEQNPGKVIGVVKDFNANSLRIGVDPMFIIKGHWRPGFLYVKLSGEDIPATIDFVKKTYSKFDSDHPFEYFFLDEKYDAQYKADISRNQLLTTLSYVCVFISLLGLLGLTAFSAVQRTKEIGIRKVLGANVLRILILLSKDILVLVILASVIAIPLGWYMIDGWLENFAYRAPFNYLLLITITLTSVMFVVFVTAFQSWRTATANPVESLKYE